MVMMLIMAHQLQRPGKIYTKFLITPGDSILLKRGDVFAGQIHDTLYGSVDHPIVIGAYGTGAKPIIYGDGRELVWEKIAGRTGYYKANLNGYPTTSSYLQAVGEWRMGDVRWYQISRVRPVYMGNMVR
jgi:hypothetical protein